MTAGVAPPWEVELDLFQGPLHTLLELIERRELPITRVSLVAVADQYLAVVRSSSLDLDLTAEFLHIAARLLLLKSQALLPTVEQNEQPEESDDEDDLEARLVQYRAYRDAARALALRQEQGLQTFGRQSHPASTVQPAPIAIDLRRLQRAAQRAIERLRLAQRTRESAPKPLISFSEVLTALVERLRRRQKMRFDDIVGEAHDTMMAITMFLAMLELVRQRRLRLVQDKLFGPIELMMEE